MNACTIRTDIITGRRGWGMGRRRVGRRRVGRRRVGRRRVGRRRGERRRGGRRTTMRIWLR
jgi:hypothetical protein